MARFKTIHELRRQVTARDKTFIMETDHEVAVDFVVETYDTYGDAATDFVHYLRGTSPEEPKATTRGTRMERLGWSFNKETFEWEKMSPEEMDDLSPLE